LLAQADAALYRAKAEKRKEAGPTVATR
jgi:PleD family two-component response regulator